MPRNIQWRRRAGASSSQKTWNRQAYGEPPLAVSPVPPPRSWWVGTNRQEFQAEAQAAQVRMNKTPRFRLE